MRTFVKSIVFAAAMLFSVSVWADGYTVTRTWCGGIIHRKYVAGAKKFFTFANTLYNRI